MKAVIFDLWDTLVDWPVDEAQALNRGLAARIGLSEAEFAQRWQAHYVFSQTQPLATLYRAIGVPEEHVETHVSARHEFARQALRPRDGALPTLAELRRRGIRLGLISMCSEDVPAVWPETALAGCFDAETFSATTGSRSPTRRSTWPRPLRSASSRRTVSSSATAPTTSLPVQRAPG